MTQEDARIAADLFFDKLIRINGSGASITFKITPETLKAHFRSLAVRIAAFENLSDFIKELHYVEGVKQ